MTLPADVEALRKRLEDEARLWAGEWVEPPISKLLREAAAALATKAGEGEKGVDCSRSSEIGLDNLQRPGLADSETSGEGSLHIERQLSKLEDGGLHVPPESNEHPFAAPTTGSPPPSRDAIVELLTHCEARFLHGPDANPNDGLLHDVQKLLRALKSVPNAQGEGRNGVRPCTPSENLLILAARLSEHLSPAEDRELRQAACWLADEAEVVVQELQSRVATSERRCAELEKELAGMRILAAEPHSIQKVKNLLGPLSLWSQSGLETYVSEKVQAALAQPPLPARPPEGWQMVPKEPTSEIISAGNNRVRYPRFTLTSEIVKDCYRAMLAAAQPPVAPKGEG